MTKQAFPKIHKVDAMIIKTNNIILSMDKKELLVFKEGYPHYWEYLEKLFPDFLKLILKNGDR